MVRWSFGRVALVYGLGAVLTACAASRSSRAAETYSDEMTPAQPAEIAAGEYDARSDAAGEVSGGNALSYREPHRRGNRGAPPPPPAPPPDGKPVASDGTTPGAGADVPAAPDRGKRLMIYRANYQIIVSSVDKSIDELLTMVKTRGGYLEARQDNTLTLRVPADLYFEVLDLLPRFGRITQQNLQAVDVTRQFADLQLRIANARASRDRLAKLLEQANKMEDIIKIEAELRRLTQEIEQLEGELRGIGDQIAFSTLTVAFLSNAPEPSVYPQRQVSRFDWVNQVGLEAVQYGF